ncbi:hypothetical protein C9374_013770 [Naegleria lovaniensis]|uniref:CAP N-terminal domain-containing protein n=1 Tax=Naegleria lovaniensis TaxID=51637 RepID=A0AA88GBG3_NAELO|nr:uncharacterized protein C9374_013770 [Naegleria lovaniensis]KAG2370859.1 hypothetical protein C9374_013770 [Naegleria lovaniensis]
MTQDILARLEKCVSRLEKINFSSKGGQTSGGSVGSSTAPQVVAYDEYYKSQVVPLLETCEKIGGDLAKAKSFIEAGFHGLSRVIQLSSTHSKPASDAVLGEILEKSGIGSALSQSADFRFKNFKSSLANHLYVVEEGLKVVLWPTSTTAVSYVKEMVNAVQFYTNKILTSTKGNNDAELHKAFVTQWKNAIEELAVYVKEYHMSGLNWSKSGEKASANALP